MDARLQKKYNRLYNLVIIIEGLIVFSLLFLAVLIYSNWDAVRSEITYAVNRPTVSSTPIPTNTPVATPTPIFEPAHIVIEKIGVDAPVQWNIPAELTVEALNNGVAHLHGSAKLGEIGNVFITGHSSDYVWKKNPYAAVFSLLPKLKVGDIITVQENGKKYVYRVAQTRIVNPSQVEVTSPTTTPVLTLMTCYPIGSTRQRFIVHASLISSPEKPVPVSEQDKYKLPEIKFR
jgi:LPXTG-site transpeptidase (sortase) family protein